MHELAPGGQATTAGSVHVSIRVPWHDRAWDGAVCDNPQANTSCLILPRIAAEKGRRGRTARSCDVLAGIAKPEWPALRRRARRLHVERVVYSHGVPPVCNVEQGSSALCTNSVRTSWLLGELASRLSGCFRKRCRRTCQDAAMKHIRRARRDGAVHEEMGFSDQLDSGQAVTSW